MNTPMSSEPDSAQSDFLSMMARTTLNSSFLASVNGSNIYQITEGWQRETILNEKNCVVVNNSIELESAVQAPDIYTIFIPKASALTQAVTERILERNPLRKTLYWEV